MLVLHAADIHLGKRQYGLKEREEDYYKAFNDMVEKAIKERVDAVLISGDLFDTPVPHSSMKPFKVAVTGISRLREKGIEVFMIPGDHDYPKVRGYPAIGYLSELTGAKLLVGEAGAKGHEYKGFKIHGIEVVSPTRTKPLEYLKKVRPERNSILMLHAGLCNVFPFGCVDEAKVPPGYKYYALGHIHKPKQFYFRGAPAAYPGSLEITSVDEVWDSWKKQFNGYEKDGPLLVDLSGDEAKVVGRIKVYARPQVKLSFELPKDYSRALKAVSEIPEGAVVHLFIYGRPARNQVSVIASKFQQKALTVRVTVKEESVTKEEEERTVGYVTLDSALIQVYGKELGSMLYELVTAIEEDEKVADEILKRIYESEVWRRASRASRLFGR